MQSTHRERLYLYVQLNINVTKKRLFSLLLLFLRLFIILATLCVQLMAKSILRRKSKLLPLLLSKVRLVDFCKSAPFLFFNWNAFNQSCHICCGKMLTLECGWLFTRWVNKPLVMMLMMMMRIMEAIMILEMIINDNFNLTEDWKFVEAKATLCLLCLMKVKVTVKEDHKMAKLMPSYFINWSHVNEKSPLISRLWIFHLSSVSSSFISIISITEWVNIRKAKKQNYDLIHRW